MSGGKLAEPSHFSVVESLHGSSDGFPVNIDGDVKVRESVLLLPVWDCEWVEHCVGLFYMDSGHLFAAMESCPTFKSEARTQQSYVPTECSEILGLLVYIHIQSLPVGEFFSVIVLVSFDPFEFAGDGERFDSAPNILQHVK